MAEMAGVVDKESDFTVFNTPTNSMKLKELGYVLNSEKKIQSIFPITINNKKGIIMLGKKFILCFPKTKEMILVGLPHHRTELVVEQDEDSGNEDGFNGFFVGKEYRLTDQIFFGNLKNFMGTRFDISPPLGYLGDIGDHVKILTIDGKGITVKTNYDDSLLIPYKDLDTGYLMGSLETITLDKDFRWNT